MTGAGIDIWDASDRFQFVYQPVTGDTQIVAYIANLEAVAPYSKAGVMIRAGLTGPSANAYMRLTEANGWRFNRRLVSGSTMGGGLRTVQPPHQAGCGWCAKAACSAPTSRPDGTTWTLIGSDTIAILDCLRRPRGNQQCPDDDDNGEFSNVAVSAPTTTNQGPTIALSAPAGARLYGACQRDTDSDRGRRRRIDREG